MKQDKQITSICIRIVEDKNSKSFQEVTFILMHHFFPPAVAFSPQSGKQKREKAYGLT